MFKLLRQRWPTTAICTEVTPVNCDTALAVPSRRYGAFERDCNEKLPAGSFKVQKCQYKCKCKRESLRGVQQSHAALSTLHNPRTPDSHVHTQTSSVVGGHGLSVGCVL
jgi:hypothetical protein